MASGVAVTHVRRKKLARFRELGIEPFAYNFRRTHGLAEAATQYERAEESGEAIAGEDWRRVRIGGRVVTRRDHGRSVFMNLVDDWRMQRDPPVEGMIQVFFQKKVLSTREHVHGAPIILNPQPEEPSSEPRPTPGRDSSAIATHDRGPGELPAPSGEAKHPSGIDDTESQTRSGETELPIRPEPVRDRKASGDSPPSAPTVDGPRDLFSLLGLLDVGDWIGVEGPLFRTRMGEVTVRVESWTLLTKALDPLPLGKVGKSIGRSDTDPSMEPDRPSSTGVHRYSTLADKEARRRMRAADLAVRSEEREVFRLRARVISALRSFLDGEGFLEVETPVLQPLYGGASARPFVTRHHALDRKVYLRIADELYLKRLIVGGLDRVYEIAKDFRNEGLSRLHNPEFTMLEWYQAFSDYRDQMCMVESILGYTCERVTRGLEFIHRGREISMRPPFRRLRLLDALSEELGEDVDSLGVEELRERAIRAGVADVKGAGRGKLIDKLFGVIVEPDLVQPTFVMDHPQELSPLAKAHRAQPTLTERFELYARQRLLRAQRS